MLLPLTAMGGDIVYSYDTGESQQFRFGTNKRETYDIAIRLHAQELSGAQIKEIRVPVTAAVAKMKDCQVWASTTLDEHDLWSQDVTPDPEERMITVALPDGIGIDGDDIYLGFTFGLSATNLETKMPVLAVSGDGAEGKSYIRCSAVNHQWADLGPNGSYYLCIQALLGNMPDNGAWVSSIARVDQVKDTEVMATVDLRNTGAAGLQSIDYAYTLDGKSGTGHLELAEPIANRYNALAKVPIAFPVIDTRGAYELQFTLTAANGEQLAQADPVNGEINIYDRLASRRVMMEEFTSMTCGYCLRGTVGIEYLKEKYPDTFIPVVYHIGDDLQLMSHLPYPVDSQPNCLIDRSWLIDPYMGSSKSTELGIEDDFLYALSQFTYGDIDVKAAWADNDKKTINIQSTANFIKDCPDEQFRVDYFIVGDGLTGDPAMFYQDNYYSGADTWAEYESLAPYLADKRMIAPFTFNDVLLFWSDDDPDRDPFVPAFKANDDINLTYSCSLPAFLDREGVEHGDLRVVAALVEHSTGHILNCAKCDITAPSGIAQSMADDGIQSEATYYDLTGRRVAQPQQGVYVKVQDGKAMKVKM